MGLHSLERSIYMLFPCQWSFKTLWTTTGIYSPDACVWLHPQYDRVPGCLPAACCHHIPQISAKARPKQRTETTNSVPWQVSRSEHGGRSSAHTSHQPPRRRRGHQPRPRRDRAVLSRPPLNEIATLSTPPAPPKISLATRHSFCYGKVDQSPRRAGAALRYLNPFRFTPRRAAPSSASRALVHPD